MNFRLINNYETAFQIASSIRLKNQMSDCLLPCAQRIYIRNNSISFCINEGKSEIPLRVIQKLNFNLKINNLELVIDTFYKIQIICGSLAFLLVFFGAYQIKAFTSHSQSNQAKNGWLAIFRRIRASRVFRQPNSLNLFWCRISTTKRNVNCIRIVISVSANQRKR